jgi:hypothetical protein
MNFQQFVAFLFERPDGERDWYFEDGFAVPDMDAQTAVAHTTRLFNSIDLYAGKLTERRFCLGMDYLINPSASDHCYYFVDAAVPESDKVALFASMYDVFSSVFAHKCSDTLSHIAPTPHISYNGICYMWWDVLPRHGIPAQQEFRAIDAAILGTLVKILQLQSSACQEAALHGLGHWHVGYPEFVERVIDDHAARIPAQLQPYAGNARIGHVQ